MVCQIPPKGLKYRGFGMPRLRGGWVWVLQERGERLVRTVRCRCGSGVLHVTAEVLAVKRGTK